MRRPSILEPVVSWLKVRATATRDSQFQFLELPIDFYQNLFEQLNQRLPRLTETLADSDGALCQRIFVDTMAIYDLFDLLITEEIELLEQQYTKETYLKEKLLNLAIFLKLLADYMGDATQGLVEETGILAQIATCFQRRYDPEIYQACDHELLARPGFQNAPISILPGIALRVQEFCLIFVRRIKERYGFGEESITAEDMTLVSNDLSSGSRYFEQSLVETVEDSFLKSRSLTPVSTSSPKFERKQPNKKWKRSQSDNGIRYGSSAVVEKKSSKSSLSACVSVSANKSIPMQKLGFWQKWNAMSRKNKWKFGALVLTEAVAIAILSVFVPGSTLFTGAAAAWITANVLAVMAAGAMSIAADCYVYSKLKLEPINQTAKTETEARDIFSGIRLRKSKTRRHYSDELGKRVPEEEWPDLSSGSDDSGDEDERRSSLVSVASQV